MFILSPVFPLLLTFIAFIAYKFIFDAFTLCDNGCYPLLIDQLRDNLAVEMNKTTDISKNLTEFLKTFEEIKETSEVNSAIITENNKKVKLLQNMLIKSLQKTLDIDASIIKIDPNLTEVNRPFIEYQIRDLRSIIVR
jgi:hypothetical protein